MTLVRRQPVSSSVPSWNLNGTRYPSVFDEFERLFNQLATPSFSSSQWTQGYPIDLYETGEELVLQMAVPGIQVEELDVSIEGRELTIKGSLPEHEGEERRYWLQNIPHGEFRRSINLPAEVDIENVNATVENGMLTLRMPKVAHARVRRIAISNSR
jgi:HSP20 family protein